MSQKRNLILIILTDIVLFIFICRYFIFNLKKKKETKNLSNKLNSHLTINKTLDYEREAFAILSRNDCSLYGLFSYYGILLGCMLKYLKLGYIPIIKIDPFNNIFKVNSSSRNINPWEMLFNQPFGYTLEEVKKYAKNISEFSCVLDEMGPNDIPPNFLNIEFFRDMGKKYIPIKKEIIDEENNIWKKLFKNTKNVLGVLGRGTDLFNSKPYIWPSYFSLN